MMRLSCQVSTDEVYRKAGVTSYQGDLEEVFPRLAGWGYQGIELTVREPSAVDCRRIETLSAQYQLPITMICTGELYGQDRLSFSDPDPKVRAEALRRFKGAVDLAERFGVDVNLGRVRGGIAQGEPPEVQVHRIESALREVADYAENKGVTIVLEPVNTLALNYINTTEEGLSLVEKISSASFQLMVDTAHLHIEDRDVPGILKQAMPHIRYVHLADSNRKYPGGGVFRFSEFISLLEELGYEGWLSVEVFPLPDQDTAFRLASQNILPLISD